MKGVSISINTLVIVILALIVIIAILALFFGVWPSGVSTITLEAAKNNACQILLSARCEISTTTIVTKNFDANGDGTRDSSDTLLELCRIYDSGYDDTDCKKYVCNCPEEYL